MSTTMDRIDRLYDKHPALASLVSGAWGLREMSDPRNISRMTGTEHLYHITPAKNVPTILEEGLRVSRSYDPTTISRRHGMQHLARGYVFTGRTKKPLGTMGQVLRVSSGLDKLNIHKDPGTPINRIRAVILAYLAGDKPKTLNIRIPYSDLQDMSYVADPGWVKFRDYTNKNIKSPFVRAFRMFNNRAFSPAHTMAFSQDIPAEYIRGGRRFRHGVLNELAGMLPYAKRNPGRFVRGTGRVGFGTGLVGLTVYQLIRKLREAHIDKKGG